MRRRVLPRPGAAPRHRGVQLPAGRGRRDEHGRRVRDVVVVGRLRRLRPAARPVHAAPAAVAGGHGDGAVRRALGGRLPRRRLPPPGAARPARPAGRPRAHGARRDRAGVHRLPRHLRGGLGVALRGPAARQPVQRRLLGGRDLARGAAAARHPQRHDRRRPVRRVRQGRVQPGAARDRLPLPRRPRRLRRAQHLQVGRQGDRRPPGHEPHLHGEVRRGRGQLVPHPPQPATRRRAGHARRRRARASPP